MSERNEHFENFILVLIAGVLVIGFVVYVLYLFWPYFVFYVLPLVFGSLLIGGFLRLTTISEEVGVVNYRRLNFAYPILICLVAMIFFAKSDRAIIMDKRGNRTGTYLDWPDVNKTFNEDRASTYASSPFNSLKAKARESVVYDRQELGWIALWCLFLGGPAFFWFLTRDASAREDKVITETVTERMKYERERLVEKERGINEAIALGIQKMEEKVLRIERERASIAAENQVLRAKVEFSPDIPRPPESIKTGGVLDKDIL